MTADRPTNLFSADQARIVRCYRTNGAGSARKIRQLKSGKIHNAKGRGALTTLCGLKTNKCPGEMLPDDAGDVNCAVCIRIRRRPPRGEIAWEFRWHDGDVPRWSGFVDREERYGIPRLTWHRWDDFNTGDSHIGRRSESRLFAASQLNAATGREHPFGTP
jgi:hypothetical protein